MNNGFSDSTIELQCPTCHKAIRWSEDFPERPFCSERCKLIDLGEWASEGHVIAGDPVPPADEDN